MFIMSLFIGNIAKTVTAKDLHAFFDKYGKNAIDVKGNYAFVDFDQVRAAEQAKNALNGKQIGGKEVKVEWSRGNRNMHQPPKGPKPPSKGDIECYVCKGLGHMAKECKMQEKSENGHQLPFDRDTVLENLRRERSRSRMRLKSPGRYAKVMESNYQLIRQLPEDS
jgi:RNA recognition motif-containing protein